MDTSSSPSGESESASAPSSSAPYESFLLLANGTQGAAAIGLIEQVLECPTLFVFGEILSHPNLQALATSSTAPAQGPAYLQLLRLFAYGTYRDYVSATEASDCCLPSLSEGMRHKLRLLSLATLATGQRWLPYTRLLDELGLSDVRQLEDLIIAGASLSVVRGKLDQQAEHFEVDFAMARDIQQSEVSQIVSTLENWCDSCDGMLRCLENQVTTANEAKLMHLEHKIVVNKKASEIRFQLKAQQQLNETEDPDSRMDGSSSSDRASLAAAADRREKKTNKGKGIRGSAKATFWQK